MNHLKNIKNIVKDSDFSDEIKQAVLKAKSTREVLSILKPSDKLVKLAEDLYAKNSRTS